DNWNGLGSLFIAIIEFILFINLLVFTEKNKFNNTAILIVLLLAVYQSFEFLMCQIGLDYPLMPYLAFVSITFLPPLMVILLAALLKYENKFLKLVFLPAIVFVVYYTFIIDQFVVTSCAVLYASYNFPLGDLYGFIYYTPIIISTIILIRTVVKESDKKLLFSAKVLLFGNIFIIIPVVIGFLLIFSGSYILISKIESIMCKFAFIYAVCISFICLYSSKRKNGRNNPEHLSGN
ncbi:MAG: hypothetical protein O6940_09030, partial [Ignavibacteria bacterium]|nr:hypothetical protein [Ignavibacteria bacterium]